MAISKVIYGGKTLIDLTADTIEPQYLKEGETAHGANGELITGTCTYDADTKDANAKASEILAGQTAYVNKNKLTGTMTNRGSVTINITTLDGECVEQGFHDGGGKAQIAETEREKLIPSNIRDGITILGVEGTMSGSEGVKPQSKSVTPSASQQTVLPDSGYTHLSQVTVAPIPYVESNNSAGGKTVTIG